MHKRKTSFPILLCLASMLCGSCAHHPAWLRRGAALSPIDYQREVKISPMTVGERVRTFPQPVFFPESQLKYGMFQNYLHYWIDRPLFFDRDTRYASGSFAHTTAESFLRDWDIARTYEFDGYGFLSGDRLYRSINGFLREANVPIDFHEFPLLAYGSGGNGRDATIAQHVERFTTLLRLANDSPYTARPNGKMLFATYYSAHAGLDMDGHRQVLEALRDEFGDTFAIAGELAVSREHQQLFLQSGSLPADVLAEYRRKAQDILDTFGALQLAVTIRVSEPDGDYTFGYTTELFTQCLLPMLLELMARPENRGRLVGCKVMHGYVNHLSGVNDGEYGTARLRDSMDAAMSLNPDFIFFFEWNEFNENTCIQPTLCNSMATQRLLKFYFRRLRGLPATPNPGDDPETPNLILSHRETLKLGDRLEFELLNVPDSERAGTYRARLAIKDIDGNTLVRFPAETLSADKLHAITYSIPSEDLAEHTVLLPELETWLPGRGKRTFTYFQHVRIHPTMCYNYKAIRQPLRDLLEPREANLAVTRNADGSYRIAAHVAANETLASLEVLDNGSEVAAVDKAKEFDPAQNEIFVGTLTAKRSATVRLTITVDNTSDWLFRPWEAPNVSFGSWSRDGDTVRARSLVWSAANRFIIAVPRGEVRGALLRMTVDDEPYRLPLADLVDHHKAAYVFRTCRLDIERFDRLVDVPVRIGGRAASLTADMRSEFRHPVFHVRAVTESGKIYRGKPVLAERPAGAPIRLNVFSETRGRVVPVDVAQDRIPALEYRFDPSRGAMLRNSHEPYYDAQLGGGFIYLEPFQRTPLPEGEYHPAWANEGSDNVLVFDGASKYINFPREAFPRGCFTLEFEINMAATEQPQVLFRHFSNILGSISLFVKDGKLHAGYGDRSLTTTRIATGIEVPVGRWTTVKVAYDLQTMVFDVDGERYSLAFSGRPLYFKPAVFGGHTKMEFGIDEPMQFFEGKLKRIRIRHFAEL